MKKLAMLLIVCMLFQVVGFAAYADLNDPADPTEPTEDVSEVVPETEDVSDDAELPADETEPAEEPSEEPAEEPSEEPSEEPAEEPSEEPAEEPSEEPAEEPAEEPSEEGKEPAEEVDEENAEEPSEEEETVAEEELESMDAETAVEDFQWDASGTEIIRYKGMAATVTIPSTAVKIRESAFAEIETLKQVQIPETVTEIGKEAFRDCSALISVNIPSSVTVIENGTFQNCVNLPAITLHNGITSIGVSAFEGCTGLGGLTLPSALTEIGRNAFKGCKGISDTVEFPSSLTDIGESAFANCTGISEIVLPASLTTLGDGAFDGCTSLARMTLPASITSIGNFTFRNCTSLTRVVVPDGVTSIGREAFYGCKSLAYVELPATVDVIQTRAFVGLANNAIIYIDADPGPTLMDTNCVDTKCTIYGHTGAASKTYATQNNIKFVPIELINFVKDCYVKILGRPGDQNGIIQWVNQLTSRQTTAAEMISNFMKNQEFKNRALSDSDVVDILYDIMTNQIPGYDGNKSTWMNALDIGVSYDYVIKGFSALADFKNLCTGTYSVAPGTVTLTENRDKNLDVTAFVQRCYQIMMLRRGDVNGLNAWTGALLNRVKTGAQVIEFFVTSPEFVNQKLDNEDTVEVLYNVMLDRPSDAGKAGWVSNLEDDHVSIRYVVNGFAGSTEFKNLCYTYVIAPGRVNLTEARDKNINVTRFVNRCYSKALMREADIGGLNTWCNAILTKTRTPQQVAWGFVFSKECRDMELGNAAFVEMLYELYMGRPSDSGRTTWINALNGGMSREDAVTRFARSAEFRAIVASYGL